MQLPVSFLRQVGFGAAFAAASVSLHAQDDANEDWNHFGLNFRAGFNIRAKFSDNSSFTLPPGPGAGAALNHQYSDGFVNVDSSGNTGGKTWNWGYQNASQISGGDVLMHATGTTGGSEEKSDDPNLGFDFNYIRDIGHYGWGQLGVKIAFGYTHVQISDNDPLSVGIETASDKYALNGVVPPAAPYSGSFSGPGPVLGSEPISRSIAMTGESAVSADHSIDASLFDLRLGPSVNIPLSKRFSFQGGGGLALGLVDSDFTFAESNGHILVSGANTSTGFVAGAYAEGGFAYRFSHGISVFTGAQFEYLGDFQQSDGTRSAQLKLGQTIFYELGLEWQF
jgi:hypothetical protein